MPFQGCIAHRLVVQKRHGLFDGLAANVQVARQLWVGADVFGEFSESVRVHTLATKNYVPKAGIKVGSGTTTSSTMLSPHLIKKPLTCPPEEDKLKEA